MVWNTNAPDGAVSVKANESILQANTTYTLATMNVSHYWNDSATLDGNHQFVACPDSVTDIAVPADNDGILYFKAVSADNTRVEGFYQNADKIYQFIPSFQEGTVALNTSTYVTVATLPANCYGEVYLFLDSDTLTSDGMQFGTFHSGANILQAYSAANGNTAAVPIILGNNTNASVLTLRAKASQGSAATYTYKIKYWQV